MFFALKADGERAFEHKQEFGAFVQHHAHDFGLAGKFMAADAVVTGVGYVDGRPVTIASQDFTVAGIGDMAGDVFGNGMLLSRHTKLVAAFNHMHIFLDPDPDPEEPESIDVLAFELAPHPAGSEVASAVRVRSATVPREGVDRIGMLTSS